MHFSSEDVAVATTVLSDSTPHRVVVILKPRLDVPFKQSDVPTTRSPLTPIRQHWADFVNQLFDEHRRRDDHVVIIEKPLWQFTRQFVETFCQMMMESSSADEVVVYVPHKDREDFPLWHPFRARYYMQTVFPHCFTIDTVGWGASMSCSPIPIDGDANSVVYDHLKDRIVLNISKFGQPAATGRSPFWGPYVTFLCQIPHDETIRKHSAVSVLDALGATLRWATATGKKVLVKGHPVNPGSMSALRDLTKQLGHYWVDDKSIHDVLAHCMAVFTVNSGSGIEAMLHGKPVYTFGRSEYELAVNITSPDTIERSWSNDRTDIITYRSWFDNYWQVLYDTTNSISFRKVP